MSLKHELLHLQGSPFHIGKEEKGRKSTVTRYDGGRYIFAEDLFSLYVFAPLPLSKCVVTAPDHPHGNWVLGSCLSGLVNEGIMKEWQEIRRMMVFL